MEKMLEELERRNYSQTTVRAYRMTICDLERYLKTPADQLEPEQVREYQVHLFRDRKLAANTVNQRTGALRFFFIKTLRKPWSLDDTPYPRQCYQLPRVLSQEEVARMIDAAPTAWY
jgi:site-specific recombinase XerD